MSAVEQEKQIEKLLVSLGDTSLKQSRNSVRVSFNRMMDYIDDHIKLFDEQSDKSSKHEHIKLLLNTYREMASNYYTQFEVSLLGEIIKRGELQSQVDSVVKLIGEGETNILVRKVLVGEGHSAKDEQESLINNFPTLMQNALDKLSDEWQRLDTILVAMNAIGKDTDLQRSLDMVVEMAALSVGIDDERIVVVPGRQFALYFFSYLNNFAVLTVPIYSVQSPSEWSIFWHELGGYQVRRLDKEGALTIESIRTNLLSLKTKELASKDISVHNKFGDTYLKELFESSSPEFNDLGDFEYQFERVLENLPEKDRYTVYDFMKRRGWCIDWFKELFEDAFSVLAFGRDFLEYFADILSRHVAMDGRHPPKEIRMGVANALLDLADPSIIGKDFSSYFTIKDHPGFPVLEENDKKVIAITAKQITKFMSLINFSNNQKLLTKFTKVADSMKTDTKNQLEGGMRLFVLTLVLGGYYSKVMNYIRESIKNQSEEIKEFDLIKDDESSSFFKLIEEKLIPVSRVNDLLGGLDYTRLLDLSFFDVDFLKGTNTVMEVKYHNIVKHKNFTLTKEIPDSALGVGDVEFTIGKKTYRTSQKTWNDAADQTHQV